MPTISGSLNLVTDRPVDSISEVWVRARETRGQGTGLVVGVNDRVAVSDGAIEFTALSGAAVLVLVQNGMPIETLPMLVSDEAQQSLRAVVQAAEVASSADKHVIEQLSTEVAANMVRAEQYRTEAASSASEAQASESAAATSESNAKSSENRAKQSETNAGDYAAVATTAAAEAVDAMDAAALSAAAFSIYTGTGSPEGKVTAPVGSVYTDSAATNGAIRWIKTSGTENKGWEVEYGDTGWRDIKDPSYSGDLLIRRVGAMVTIKLFRLSPSEDVPAPKIATLDLGFRPSGRSVGLLTKHNALTEQGRLWVDSASATILMGAEASATETWPTTLPFTGVHTYHTDKPWPTTLPGTPA